MWDYSTFQPMSITDSLGSHRALWARRELGPYPPTFDGSLFLTRAAAPSGIFLLQSAFISHAVSAVLILMPIRLSTPIFLRSIHSQEPSPAPISRKQILRRASR